jgi:hypothetical protein
VNRTRLGDLLGVLIGMGLAGYVLLRVVYASLPALSPVTPVPLAALAAAELVLARRVRRVVGRDPDVKAMTAISIARLVALGKASALVGAGVAGAALALVAHVAPDVGRVSVARSDAVIAGLVAAAGVLLCVAGLLVERAGVAPRGRSPRAGGVR